MAFIPAAGHPNYQGTFIPYLFSQKVLVRLYDALCLPYISNTDYENEIKGFGSQVIIRKDPDINIFDTVPGAELPVQKPDTDTETLTIDRAKGWNFLVHDFDKAQSDINIIDRWSVVAVENKKRAIETQVFGAMYADIHADNQGTTAGTKSGAFNLGTSGAPIAVDKTNILDYIIHMGTVLDEQNIPDDGGWWILLPPIFENMLKRSDIKDASLTGDSMSTLRNGGRVGKIDRFSLYKTNNVPYVADGSGVTAYYIMAGHKMGLTFAMQVEKSEAIPSPTTFGKLMRGYAVYGFEVVRPEAISLLYANAVLT